MSKKDRDKQRKKRKFQGDQLQKRIKKGQEKTKDRISVLKSDVNVEVFKPDYDQHTLDIIPYYAGKNDPTVEEGSETYTFEYEVHKYVGSNNKWYICPRMFGKKCPICDYRDKLRSEDNDEYKNYWTKTRNLYNIVCEDSKKERKKGIQVFDIPYFYFEKNLMAISKKPPKRGKEERTVNFAHPTDGKSIVFERQKPKSENDYDKYAGFQFDDREYEIDQNLIEQAHQLDELVYIASYDEIKKEFFGKDGKPANKGFNKGDDDMAELDFEELFSDLEECEDNDELEEFLDDNDIDEDDTGFDEDNKFKKNMKAVKSHLEELKEELEKKKNKKKDKKGKKDKKDKKKKPKYTKDDLEELSFKKLCKLVEKEGLEDDIDIEDFDKDERDDLIEEICEALGIEDDDN